jgi:hypothetical protein
MSFSDRIKWLVAKKEMEELERWRTWSAEHRQWLTEFPDIADTLDNVSAMANGKNCIDVTTLRDRFRSRRK